MFLNSIAEITDKYDCYLIDVWGVLHNGAKAFSESVDALKYLKSKNKKILILTNSPNRSNIVADKLMHKGVEDVLYDEIISSGEVFYNHLIKISSLKNKKYYIFSSSYDADILDSDNYSRINNINDADFVILQGISENFNNDQNQLKKLLLRDNLPVFCVNPDFYVRLNGELALCAGYLAKIYEDLGGKIIYFGKPYPNIYEASLHYANMPKEKILAIGDNINTDILGARNFGIDSLLVLSGVLGSVDGATNNYLMEKLKC